MKKIFFGLLFLFFMVGCSEKMDQDALQNLSQSLKKRWEHSETLGEELSMEDLEKLVEIELEVLKDYDIDDFKDITIYSRHGMYKSALELMQINMTNADINSSDFHEKWNDHIAQRGKIIYDIHSKNELNISDEHREYFDDLIFSANHLIKSDDIMREFTEISGLDGLDIEIEDDSIAINFPTESVLSVDSFVARKIGFPDKAMEILNVMKDHDYEDIVISTTNQDVIAISSYFTKESLNSINFDKWDDLDSHDAYEFYSMADAYHIRLGIWNELSSEAMLSIGEMNKDNSEPFWKNHGFTH